MTTHHNFEFLHAEGSTPIKGWVRGVPVDTLAQAQLRNIAAMPFVGPWVAVMPDVHVGKGATVGSVRSPWPSTARRPHMWNAARMRR